MFKRMMIVSAITVSIAMVCIATATPARASGGYSNRIIQTESLVSAEAGEVHLPGAHKATKVNFTESLIHHKVIWTPRQQAMWQIRHHYHRAWNARNEFRCLNKLWTRESGWNKYATNPYSGAYGIPQSLPADKMASAGANWRYSSSTQIRWGLRYIRRVYRLPCRAWSHELYYGWYLVNEKQAKTEYLGRVVVKTAEKYYGCNSLYGGISCSPGFDCSGLVYITFHHLGQYGIPRVANDQMNWAKAVQKLMPGDLVFYGDAGYASHVAIYVGRGKVLQADVGPTVEIDGIDYVGSPIAFRWVPFHWKPKN